MIFRKLILGTMLFAGSMAANASTHVTNLGTLEDGDFGLVGGLFAKSQSFEDIVNFTLTSTTSITGFVHAVPIAVRELESFVVGQPPRRRRPDARQLLVRGPHARQLLGVDLWQQPSVRVLHRILSSRRCRGAGDGDLADAGDWRGPGGIPAPPQAEGAGWASPSRRTCRYRMKP